MLLGNNEDQMSVLTLLQNIDTAKTDCRSLVLFAHIMWPNENAQVYDFVQKSYKKCGDYGLHKQNNLEQVWKTTKNGLNHLKTSFSRYIEIGICPHFFINKTISELMKSKVAKYSRKDRMKLTFERDVPPIFENNQGQISVKQEIFELVYNTGAITGSTGQGSLHQVFNNNARIYFLTGGGTQNMATLLKNGNIGSIMRYDASMVKWRIYNPVTGIWDLSVSFVEVSKVSDFLDRILTPILYLAEFAGPTVFDWISRTHKPLSADDDVNDEYDDADKPVKKKKTCNSAFAGELSVRASIRVRRSPGSWHSMFFLKVPKEKSKSRSSFSSRFRRRRAASGSL